MNAMATPDHRSHFELSRLVRDCDAQLLQIIEKDRRRLCQLDCERRVEDI